MIDLSIIIVSYKTPQLLDQCLESIHNNSTNIKCEIIIIDNASGDGSKEKILAKYQNILWIDSGYNAGFSRANNIGFRNARGEYVFILNPDAITYVNFIDKLMSFYKEFDSKNNLGLLTTRIVSSIDGSLQIGSGIGFPGYKKELKKNPFYILIKRYFNFSFSTVYDPQKMHYLDHKVDVVSGACAMFKLSKLKDSNLFMDEDFFLYSEDVEWSYRFKKSGYQNYFFSGIEIGHVNSASTAVSINKNAQIRISEFLYYKKRYDGLKYQILGLLIRFNYFLNTILLKRKKEEVLLSELNNDKLLFKQYFYQIQKKYRKTISTERTYLRYVEENIK